MSTLSNIRAKRDALTDILQDKSLLFDMENLLQIIHEIQDCEEMLNQ